MTLGDRIEMQIYAYADGPAKGQPRSMTVAEILAGLFGSSIVSRSVPSGSSAKSVPAAAFEGTLISSRWHSGRRGSTLPVVRPVKKEQKSREKKSRHHVLEIDRLH
jgi:hypothetical protein